MALAPGQEKNMQGGADFDGPLVDYQARGIKVELIGSAKVEERDAWKLRVELNVASDPALYPRPESPHIP